MTQKKPRVRKKILPAILLGPEMAAPILWAPGIIAFSLQENLHAHTIPDFRGICFFGGAGKCRFCFYGRGIFLNDRGISLKASFTEVF